jgi:lipopolysaccharide heptosyltransferase I
MVAVLFVKTSSLGDVIHHMPAVTEARRHLPDARLSWVVEEDFAPLVRLHPAVDEVIAVASRRWRRAPLAASTWRDIATAAQAIAHARYDEIIDSQGLLRSALIARRARGRRHGYDWRSIREPVASLFYNVRHVVPRQAHAIQRNRLLTGAALGYAPAGSVDYGLARAKLAQPLDYGILLHATARPEKEWPVQSWISLGQALAARGIPLVVPWGTPAERERSERIAASIPTARIPERQRLDDTARLIAASAFVVGIDTGLMHLAAALKVPLVAIFTASRPDLTGPVGQAPMAVVGGEGAIPTVAKVVAALERIRG